MNTPENSNCQDAEVELRELQTLIDVWSMRPQPDTPTGDAWECGARQGWRWAKKREASNVREARAQALREAAEHLRARAAKLLDEHNPVVASYYKDEAKAILAPSARRALSEAKG